MLGFGIVAPTGGSEFCEVQDRSSNSIPCIGDAGDGVRAFICGRSVRGPNFSAEPATLQLLRAATRAADQLSLDFDR